ncbi:MAG TPA: hypothetical protein VIA62_05020 [Thermoanaerobaculia bacterium]|jgi:hypothetical protein|nr:hypothetical protein [Thermoanaerobaculia bacterium]
MTSVLILTEPMDFHAFAVAEALRRKGVDAVLWHGTDFPGRQRASVWVDESGFDLEISGAEIALRQPRFDTVWNRRPTDPVLPGHLHPADRVPAGRDCQHFVWALWHLIAPDAFWVNPLSPVASAILKPYQLRLAREIGLEIPPTLCSNDPERIVEFLRAHEGETLYKSFHAGSWKTEDGLAILYTSPVTEDDLPEDAALQAAPGIFQVRIPKDHELRVTFLGAQAVAARLHTQANPETREDWRRSASLEVEPAALPEAVARQCRELMARLGLVFGCFDFIVTPEGRHVFLEVNPMGQFLFLERLCPEIPLLDRFCDFLIARGVASPGNGVPAVRLRDVWEPAERAFLAAPEIHVPKPNKIIAEGGAAPSRGPTGSELPVLTGLSGSSEAMTRGS